MKKIFATMMAFAMLMFVLAGCGAANDHQEVASASSQSDENISAENESTGANEANKIDGEPEANAGILIAYFSKTGNTETIANMIAGQTGGELFKVETVTPYPEAYNETVDIAREEQDNDARPELSTHVEDMSQYDVIYLGYPKLYPAI